MDMQIDPDRAHTNAADALGSIKTLHAWVVEVADASGRLLDALGSSPAALEQAHRWLRVIEAEAASNASPVSADRA